jgi:hypothetical protein
VGGVEMILVMDTTRSGVHLTIQHRQRGCGAALSPVADVKTTLLPVVTTTPSRTTLCSASGSWATGTSASPGTLHRSIVAREAVIEVEILPDPLGGEA